MHGRISRTLIWVITAALCGTLQLRHAVAQAAAIFPVANPSFEGSYGALNECANITGEVAPNWTDNTC